MDIEDYKHLSETGQKNEGVSLMIEIPYLITTL